MFWRSNNNCKVMYNKSRVINNKYIIFNNNISKYDNLYAQEFCNDYNI